MISTSETAQIVTLNGPILAARDSSLICARGIPYATAPRFQIAQPAKWSALKDCTKPAPICPQNETSLKSIFGDLIQGRRQLEDCLTVSVAAPIDADGLPVMVYLHGGAYMMLGGDLDCHSTRNLAKERVVTVNVTYRMGIFGYVPIPDVAPANLGLMDQIEALRWVQHNISVFGGDSKQVTVFGQSAGGDSIVSFLATDTTKGLFSRAIIQSSPMGILHQERYNEAVAKMGEHAKEKLSTHSSTADMLVMQEELGQIAAAIAPGLKVFGPVYGQYPLPPWSRFEEQIRSRAKEVQVLIGYTRDEGTAFSLMKPQHEPSWYKRQIFEEPTSAFSSLLIEGGSSVASYTFDWSPQNSPLGACHCLDLPFLLGEFEEWRDAPMLQGSFARDEFEMIGQQMKKLWVDFAYGADLNRMQFTIDALFRYKNPSR